MMGFKTRAESHLQNSDGEKRGEGAVPTSRCKLDAIAMIYSLGQQLVDHVATRDAMAVQNYVLTEQLLRRLEIGL